MRRLAHSRRLRPVTIALSLSMVFACSCARSDSEAGEGSARGVSTAQTNVADQDRALQEAATTALGDREGAVLVMDPHSGRIRAVVNPRLAFEQAFPPGSTMKAFTALTALRAGLIDSESRSQCKGRYRQDGYQVTCSHPRSKTPFNPAQALGYSCNTYFADLASRLSPASFSSTLDQFGFGKRTEVNAGGENTGSIPGQDWHIGDAVGEGKDVTVTVVQLLTAYAALLNGGHLYRPVRGDAPGDDAKTAAEERATIRVDAMHRRILIKGMRGAVEYGTAAQAGLNSLRPFIFGKTGTSTASNGFRRQGWFAGFAATAGTGPDPPPEAIGLGLVVFIRRGSGAECAQVSRSIFEAYSTFADSPESARQQSSAPSAEPADARLPEELSGQSVRVSNVREGNTETLSLEEYVLGVVAAEASTEDEIEALRAQAITTRTFALKNLRRHAAEGFDFCSLTHCELYKRIDQEAGANIEKTRQAVRATEGEILQDSAGRIADAYFSAACGGVTANIESLWGVPAPSYLRGVRDDYCSSGSHSNWTERIPRARLSKALASDARSDAGRALKDIVVTARDATGRVAAVSLEGERRRQLRGWEFKIIVGRALGWNVLKSSRFEVIRQGENFIFRGRGFGHGLGLCQQGAHVMARRGMSNRQILDHYFPGTIAGRHSAGRASSKARSDATLLRQPVEEREMKSSSYSLVSFHPPPSRAESRSSPRTLTLSSEHFRVRYPAGCPRQDIESVLRILEATRSDILSRLGRVSAAFADAGPHEVVIHATTPDFTAATGQPWWVAGATRGRKTELQPLTLLRRRRVLASTLRHEYTHAVVEALGRGRTPRWLAEGLAIHVAGEAGAFKRVEPPRAATVEEIERRLEHPTSAEEMRLLYAAAYGAVMQIIRREGESAVWQRVSASD